MKPSTATYAWAAKERLDTVRGRCFVQYLGATNRADGLPVDGQIVYFKVGVKVSREQAKAMAELGTEECVHLPG